VERSRTASGLYLRRSQRGEVVDEALQPRDVMLHHAQVCIQAHGEVRAFLLRQREASQLRARLERRQGRAQLVRNDINVARPLGCRHGRHAPARVSWPERAHVRDDTRGCGVRWRLIGRLIDGLADAFVAHG